MRSHPGVPSVLTVSAPLALLCRGRVQQVWWEGNESHAEYAKLYHETQAPVNELFADRKKWGAWAPAGIGPYIAVVGGAWRAK